MGILERLERIAGTSGTSQNGAHVPLKPLQNKASTSGTSGTSQIAGSGKRPDLASIGADLPALVRARLIVACERLNIDWTTVLRQLEHWAPYPSKDWAEMASWSDATIEQHCRALLSEFEKDVRENLAERAAIVGENADTQEAWQSAQDAAIRLVQCRTCRHWTPDTINPADGTGTCALNVWKESRVDSGRPFPPYPNAPRYCDQHTPVREGPEPTGGYQEIVI